MCYLRGARNVIHMKDTPSFWWPLVISGICATLIFLGISFNPARRYRIRLHALRSVFGWFCLAAVAILLGMFIGGEAGFLFLDSDMYAPVTGVFSDGIGGMIGLVVALFVTIGINYISEREIRE